MNGLQKSGWKYWDHFHIIHPGTYAKGRNAFSAACAVLDQTLDSGLPSDDDKATVITFPGSLSSSLMVIDSIDSSNKRHHSISSVDGNKSLLPSSNVVTEASALHPKKALKFVAGSAAGSQTSQPVPTTGSQKVTFVKLKNLMVGLLDSLHIAPEDSTAEIHCKMTLFVHKDNHLPAQKMHIIMLFVQNVAYASLMN